MQYEEAKALAEAGKPVCYSNSGGWARWMRFTDSGYGTWTFKRTSSGEWFPTIEVRIFGAKIADFTPDGVKLSGAGYIHRITTRDALNYLLPYGYVGSHKNVIYGPGSEAWEDDRTYPYTNPDTGLTENRFRPTYVT